MASSHYVLRDLFRLFVIWVFVTWICVTWVFFTWAIVAWLTFVERFIALCANFFFFKWVTAVLLPSSEHGLICLSSPHEWCVWSWHILINKLMVWKSSLVGLHSERTTHIYFRPYNQYTGNFEHLVMWNQHPTLTCFAKVAWTMKGCFTRNVLNLKPRFLLWIMCLSLYTENGVGADVVFSVNSRVKSMVFVICYSDSGSCTLLHLTLVYYFRQSIMHLTPAGAFIVKVQIPWQ